MTRLKPCIVCGTPSLDTRCDDHQLPTHSGTPNVDHPAYANRTRWKNLSRRLRRQQPFCERCGSRDRLSVDHIVRFTDRPEWAYELPNLRVLCKPCNSELAGVKASPEVEAAIAAKIRGDDPHLSYSPTPPGSRRERYTPPRGIFGQKGDRP
ncbi:HNH endonuclease [Brevibacterium sanguinis]|uniref:HNH endonuclease n=2 Tax=Brevibacterium TaxID=1696 RepID=A0A366II81_9MICO|nr:HNH endonuclease [Brevibacterium sanguinis]RBP71563.1 HNH endonuclease [Brevibacterium celere]